jgi:two-component system chemotaxis sensor kinase CheA
MDLDHAELLPVFLAESEENLADIEESLLHLETDPDDTEVIDRLFRCAHTLKGNSESLGIDAMASAAHAFESVLQGLRARKFQTTRALVSLMLDVHARLLAMLRVAAAGGVPSLDGDHALVTRLLAAATRGEISTDASPGAGSASRIEAQTRAAPGPRTPEDLAADRTRRETLRVDLQTLDRIVTSTGELSIAHARMRSVLAESGAGALAIDAIEEADRLFADLREQVMRLRLVPVGPMFRQHLRTVRDLTLTTGKEARLVMEGEDVEVDTAVVVGLRDPIMHMIRNAIDHAIEAPDERRARGKDPVGTLTLRARHEAGRILVEIEDDGAGFDRARILERARALGMVDGSGSALTDDQVHAFVFAPGFSTSRSVTELSGRGVGMDVVLRSVLGLKGTLSVRSDPGRGSVVSIRVPLTLAIINGFAVGAAEETYVIPLESIRECIQLPPSIRRHDDGRGVMNLRGVALPYLRLRELFGLPGATPCGECVVVVEHDGWRAGIAVDALLGERQAVVKPLGKLLDRSGGITGSTILGDGRVALILDVASILRGARDHRREADPTETRS